MNTQKITSKHLEKLAIIYIRQSTLHQLQHHSESTERQYGLQEKALELGWNKTQIYVIDEDLGVSGSGRTKRNGFEELVTKVTLGKVGVILGLEISRLARSSADLLKLLELCGLFNTIVVDEDGIYDLSDFNDRLILGFKGTMSEVELHYIKARLLGGKKNKAQKGKLRFPLPVGYIYDIDKKIIIDPDEEVQTALRNVFKAFQISGSAYGVVKFFAQNNLKFPKRAYGGIWAGKIIWGTLTHSRVLSILKNPNYTGAYIFGRFKGKKDITQQGFFIKHTICLPKEQWQVFIPNHHDGYITWETYENNRKKLSDNRTNLERSGAAREGISLLQGLLICGKCGRRMTVRYTGNGGIIQIYECRGRWENGKKATCTTVPGKNIDETVSGRLIQIMQPAELELAIKATDKLLKENNSVDKMWKLQLERAKYETERLERQYQLVEPENRLVARSLETKWNQALEDFEKIKKDYEIFRSKKVWYPTEDEKKDILNLVKKFPTIWCADTTTFKDRKRIIRILIEDVTIFAEPKNPNIKLGIRWKNLYSEELFTTKPLPKYTIRKHKTKTIDMVRKLSETMTDKQIADSLNTSGIRTPEGRIFTVDSIKWIRYSHKIKGIFNKRKGFSVKEVAQKFNVTPGIVYYWISNGIVEATKIAHGYPWDIVIDSKKESELRNRLKKNILSNQNSK